MGYNKNPNANLAEYSQNRLLHLKKALGFGIFEQSLLFPNERINTSHGRFDIFMGIFKEELNRTYNETIRVKFWLKLSYSIIAQKLETHVSSIKMHEKRHIGEISDRFSIRNQRFNWWTG